jgi:hypothetical protein
MVIRPLLALLAGAIGAITVIVHIIFDITHHWWWFLIGDLICVFVVFYILLTFCSLLKWN